MTPVDIDVPASWPPHIYRAVSARADQCAGKTRYTNDLPLDGITNIWMTSDSIVGRVFGANIQTFATSESFFRGRGRGRPNSCPGNLCDLDPRIPAVLAPISVLRLLYVPLLRQRFQVINR
jgi:hypothetical protein